MNLTKKLNLPLANAISILALEKGNNLEENVQLIIKLRKIC